MHIFLFHYERWSNLLRQKIKGDGYKTISGGRGCYLLIICVFLFKKDWIQPSRCIKDNDNQYVMFIK